jgi:iron-sulfur cluster repair protein YtfE (RIC family)
MLDEATRPRAPKRPDDDVLPAGRQGQRTLLAIHGHLRDELDRVVAAVDAVAAGELDPGTARAVVHESIMARNHRLTGSFCAQYCRFVEAHHSIEDAYLFPSLETGDPSLGPVLQRLSEEHEVIHAVLVRIDELLVEMVTDGAGAAEVAEQVRALRTALTSHLDYEEEELLPPIGRLQLLA